MNRYCTACHTVGAWIGWPLSLLFSVVGNGEPVVCSLVRFDCPTRGCTNTYTRETFHTRGTAAGDASVYRPLDNDSTRGARDHDGVFPHYERMSLSSP